MKIFNLGRGQGKTTRMLYASEFNDAPIICPTEESKRYLIEQAKRLNLNIPTPMTVYDAITNGARGEKFNTVLVDEMNYVLKFMFRYILNTDVIGGTITIDDNTNSNKE